MSSVHIVQLDTGLCFCRQKCLCKNKLLQIQNQSEAFQTWNRNQLQLDLTERDKRRIFCISVPGSPNISSSQCWWEVLSAGNLLLPGCFSLIRSKHLRKSHQRSLILCRICAPHPQVSEKCGDTWGESKVLRSQFTLSEANYSMESSQAAESTINSITGERSFQRTYQYISTATKILPGAISKWTIHWMFYMIHNHLCFRICIQIYILFFTKL